MEERRNPYSATLMVFALVGLIGGGVLFVFGVVSEQMDAFSRGTVIVIGAYGLGVGALLFFVWIAVSAITWSIGEASRRSAALR